MYSSLKKWINVPVTLLRFERYDGCGDSIFSGPVTILTYPLSEITVVRNAKGVEVTSDSQLYVDGNTAISDMDHVLFDNKELPIHAIRTFYRNGIPDLKVVYL